MNKGIMTRLDKNGRRSGYTELYRFDGGICVRTTFKYDSVIGYYENHLVKRTRFYII